MRKFPQQPRPVPAQVELPQNFPEIPMEIVDRFGDSARGWQKRLDEFWTRTNQAIQQAQNQTAGQINSHVVFNVDSFLIYANGVPTPMFSVDATGVRLGGVLVVNTPGRKVYIGAGVWNDPNTPFYVDALGNFSLGGSMVWDSSSDSLTIAGSVSIATINPVLLSDNPAYLTWQGVSPSNRGLYIQRETSDVGVHLLSAQTNPNSSFRSELYTGSFAAKGACLAGALSRLEFNFASHNTGTWQFASVELYAYADENLSSTAKGTSLEIHSHANGNTIPGYIRIKSNEIAFKPDFFGTYDTNLYRSAADTLKTDDAFVVVGLLTGASGVFTDSVAADVILKARNTNAGAAAVGGIAFGNDTTVFTGYVGTTSNASGGTFNVVNINNTSMLFMTNNALRVSVTNVGVVKVENLAGVGTRNVVADAAGNLSAP